MKRCLFLILVLAAAAGFAADNPYPDRRVLATDKGHIHILNAAGESLWSYRTGYIHDLHVLENGNILTQSGLQKLIEVTPDRKVVWEYDAARSNGNEGKKVEVHAFQPLPDGRVMIAESGPGRIIEIDRDGKLLHEVKLKLDRPHPHSDTRLVRKLANGNYLVSHENDGAVREYAPDGTVVWEYIVPMFGREPRGGHGPEAFGNRLFCALRLPGGNTLIATGNGHSVLEVTPEKEIVWKIEQNDLPGIRLAWVTTLEVHPNGNIVIGNCHAGEGQPQLIEVTREKKVVWTFYDWKHLGDGVSNSQILGVSSGVIR